MERADQVALPNKLYFRIGEVAKILMELGVDYLQGYYFGKPENHRSWINSGEYRKD